MRKIIISTLVSLAFLLGSMTAMANGGSMVPPPKHHPVNFFLLFGTGYSWSRNGDVKADPVFWDPAEQGYNEDFGGSEFYTAGFGFLINHYLSLGVNVTHRPGYEYSKFQTPSGPQPLGFIGTKTRFFDLVNTSLMFNALIYTGGLTHYLLWHLSNNVTLQPFFGGAIGVAYNTVRNFHSIVAQQTDGFNLVNSIGNDHTHATLAWAFMVGLHMAVMRHVGFDLGYRYFDGGNVVGPRYIYEVSGVGAGLAVPPWKAKLRANEIFLHLIYHFNSIT